MLKLKLTCVSFKKMDSPKKKKLFINENLDFIVADVFNFNLATLR